MRDYLRAIRGGIGGLLFLLLVALVGAYDGRTMRDPAFAAGEPWIHRTVAFAGGSFDLIADAYLKSWRASKESPEIFNAWLDEIRRILSIEMRQLWIPEPNHVVPPWLPKGSRTRPIPSRDDYAGPFLRDWYEKECEPAVEKALNRGVARWKNKAVR